MPLSQNTSNVAAGIDYGSMLKQDNENARQQRVQSAMDFMQTGEVKDNRSWIQKSLSMNAPITSKKQAMSVLRRDQPDYHRQILANEEKQKEATEKLQVDQRKALKGAVPGLGTLLQQMRRLDDPEARVQLGNSGAQQIHQMIPPHLNMPQFETYTLESVTDEALDEDERELQLLGLEIQDSELTPSELNKVEENVGKMGDFQAAAKYYERRTGDQLTPDMFSNIQTIHQKEDERLTFAQQQSIAKAASKLPTLEMANQFLQENGGEGFKDQNEFVRAKAAFKSGNNGVRVQTSPDGGLIIQVGGENEATIGRMGTEQGLAAQDRNLLKQIGDFRTQVQGLKHPEAMSGVQGAMADRDWVGVLAQLPGGEFTVEAASSALGVPLRPDEFDEIKKARSALTSIQANARAISRGVQDDRNASPSEKRIADEIVRGIDAKDDYDAMMLSIDLAETLAKSRTSSLLTNQGDDLPAVSTQAEYDALQNGAMYMEDGAVYRKP